jgi:hypothetical protein
MFDWNSLENVSRWLEIARFLLIVAGALTVALSYGQYRLNARKDELKKVDDRVKDAAWIKEKAQLNEKLETAAIRATTAVEGLAAAQKDLTIVEQRQKQAAEEAVQANTELLKSKAKLDAVEQKLKPRRLSNAQQATLYAYLLKFPQQPVNVFVLSGDPEIDVYANDFVEVLNRAGWKPNVSPGMVFGGTPSGVVVVAGVKRPAAADALLTALHTAGITASGELNQDFGEHDLQITIGKKP